MNLKEYNDLLFKCHNLAISGTIDGYGSNSDEFKITGLAKEAQEAIEELYKFMQSLNK